MAVSSCDASDISSHSGPRTLAVFDGAAGHAPPAAFVQKSDIDDASSVTSDDDDDLPAVGGIRTAPTLIIFSVLIGIVVFVVGVVPITVSAIDIARGSIDHEQELVAGGVALQARNFFREAQRVPWGARQAIVAATFDLYNQTQALDFLATTIRSCHPDCYLVYYGIDTPDNYFYTLRYFPEDDRFLFNRRGPAPDYLMEGADITGVFAGHLTVGPFVRRTFSYLPRSRPWWGPLRNTAAAVAWVPIYPDFTSGISTTAGGPVLDRAGNIVAVFGVDIQFTTLFSDLGNASATAGARHAVLYEAGSRVMVYSTWGQRSNATTVYLNETTEVAMASALSSFSDADLDGTGAVTKRRGGSASALVADSMQVRSVAPETGLSLRYVLLVEAGETGHRIRSALIFSIGGGVLATIVVIIAVTIAAILVFERPLSNLSARLSADCDAALHGDDDDDDDDSQADANETPSKPVLHEMRAIQHAFEDVVEELRRVRAFIPDGCFIDPADMKEDVAPPPPSQQRRCSGGAEALDEATDGPLTITVRPHNAAPAAAPSADDDGNMLSSISSGAGGAASTPTSRPGSTMSVRSRGSSMMGCTLGASSRAWAGLQHARPTAKTGHFLTGATVAYVDLSVRGFRMALEDLPNVAATAVAVCDLIAGIVQNAATAFNGAVAHYVGDRAALSFNAVKVNTSYKRQAVECAVAVSKMVRLIRVDPATNAVGFEAAQQQYPMPLPRTAAAAAARNERAPVIKAAARIAPCSQGIAAGVAFGRALVGTIGSSGLTRFCVLSDAVQTAARRAEKCAAYDEALVATAAPLPPSPSTVAKAPTPPAPAAAPVGLQCLTSGALASELRHSVAFQYVDVVGASNSSNGGGCGAGTSSRLPLLLAPMRMLLDAPETVNDGQEAAQQKCDGNDDGNDNEWMYQLQRAEQGNEFRLINAAFEAFAASDLDSARKLLDEAKANATPSVSRVGLVQLSRLLDVGMSE